MNLHVVKINLSAVMAALVAVMALSMVHPVMAQSPVIYPSKGQGVEQQNKDTAACQGWAQTHTGVNPLAIAEAQTQATPSSGSRGGAVGGAARGAAFGAAVGAIAGDAGKGAAIGAGAGAMGGRMHKRRDQQIAEEHSQAQQQQVSAELAQYNKAFAACMEGRDYVVK